MLQTLFRWSERSPKAPPWITLKGISSMMQKRSPLQSFLTTW